MRLTLPAVAAALCLLTPAAALAHAHLRTAEPAPNANVPPPEKISVDFSEPIVAQFSGLELKDAAGRAVALKPMTPLSRRLLASEPTARLKPGRYTVQWHVVSADTHRVEGRYSFMVK